VSAALDTVVDIETPEHVRFQHRVAGPARRATAYALDLLIRGVIMLILAIPVFAMNKESGVGFILLLAFIVEWLYYVVSETLSGGRSIGKLALGLRVVREGGQPPSFIDIVLRNLLRGADFLPIGYVVGLVVAARDSHFRRLGDIVAGTMVVVQVRTMLQGRTPITPPSVDELAAFPASPRLSAEEWDALDAFVRRADIGLLRRQELAAMVAPTLASRLGVLAPNPLRFLEVLHARVLQARLLAVGGGRGGAHDDEDSFAAERRTDWATLGALLARSSLAKQGPEAMSRAMRLHRALVADLARAQAQGYSTDLLTMLDTLAARSHAALYVAPPRRPGAILDFFRRDFPAALRRRGRLLAFASLLFVLPGVVGFAGAYGSRTFAAQVLPAESMEQMEKAYGKGFADGRAVGTDLGMAGFYVYNNVGIAFRCFATGVFVGLGSVFFLFYNGLIIGAVLGLVAAAGHGRNIFTFICGHGPFELTGIVIAGVAGLTLGLTLVDPGGRSRRAALRLAAPEIARLVIGAAAMLLCAAGIEAFWSPSSLPDAVKWTASSTISLGLIAYFCFAGRRSGTP